MEETLTEPSWSALLVPRFMLPLAVLLGGVLLHSMNVLITATLLPSIVADIGGGKLMSWPTTAFVGASIIAATGTAVVSRAMGNRWAFCGGAVVYAVGAVLCGLAPSFVLIIVGRFVQGLGGGLLAALAYVLVRSVFAEPLWPRVFGLLSGVWSVTVLAGPLIGGVFAGYGNWRGAFHTVAGIGGILAMGALLIFPAGTDDPIARRFPVLRVFLICAAIAPLSCATVLIGPAVKGTFIAAAIAAFVVMLRIDRAALAPASKRCLLAAVANGCGAMDGLAAVRRLHPTGDIRAAVSAATAWAQAAPRRVHGGWSIAVLDVRRADRGLPRGRMAATADRRGTSQDERGPSRRDGADGAGAGCWPGPTDRTDRDRHRRLVGHYRATCHERGKSHRGNRSRRVSHHHSTGRHRAGCRNCRAGR
jgi:MFS family permease